MGVLSSCCQASGRALANRSPGVLGHRLLGIARLPRSDFECRFLDPTDGTPSLGAGARSPLPFWRAVGTAAGSRAGFFPQHPQSLD